MNTLLSLMLSWMLTWFNFDTIFMRSVNELFNINITINGYYFIFFLIGVIADIINFLRQGR